MYMLVILILQYYAIAVGLMTALWRNNKAVKTWHIPKPCLIFRERYDVIQEQLHTISCMDDLLSGEFQIPYYSDKILLVEHYSQTVQNIYRKLKTDEI